MLKRGRLSRASLLTDNRSHAPVEVGSNVRQLLILQSRLFAYITGGWGKLGVKN